MHLTISTPRRLVVMFLCLPPPPVAVEGRPPSPPPRRRYGYLLPSSRNSQLDQCCLFAMICLDHRPLFTLCILFTLSFFALCCYPHLFAHVFLYIYPPCHTPLLASFLTSFRHCFLNHIFQSLASHRFSFSISVDRLFLLEVESLSGVK